MATARFQHAAVPLGGGRVLVCGGRSFNPPVYYDLCEIYSAATNRFSATEPLRPARAFFSLTPTAPGQAFAIAGNNQTQVGAVQYLDDVWRYDFQGAAGTWTSLGTLGSSRRNHQSTWLPAANSILVTGGVTTLEKVVPSDARSNNGAWVAVSPGVRRYEHTLTALGAGDRALVVGGRASDTEELGTVKLLTVTGGVHSWTDLTATSPRFSHTATLIPASGSRPESVLLAGGYADSVNLVATTVRYDPSGAGLPTEVAALAPRRAYHAAVLLHGKVIVTGGLFGNEVLKRVDVYDPEKNIWYDLDSMNAARYSHTLTPLDDDSLLVTGGQDQVSALASAEVLRPRLPGESCDSTRRECLSGHCIDGVCCLVACDDSCQRCDTQGVCHDDVTGAPLDGRAACADGYLCGKGACLTKCSSDAQCDTSGYYCDGRHCLPRQRQAAECTRDAECIDGLPCIDGFCCNSKCEGQCEACDKREHEGTCTAIDGPVHGSARPSCGGVGECGLTCDGTDRDRCHFPEAGRSCSQNRCVEGLEEHEGECDGRGSCSDVPVDCVRFACDASTSTCGDTCSDDSQCLAGHFCKGDNCVELEGLGEPCPASGACVSGLVCEDGVCCGEACEADSSCDAVPGFCKKLAGAECKLDAHCGSGYCADGVCCESACAGQCEACNLVDHVGQCRPVVGEPVSPREACDAGVDLCSARSCDGRDDHRDSCEGYANLGQSCAGAECREGRFLGARSCDSAGKCSGSPAVSCGPYACANDGCLDRCEAPADCANDMTCIANQCVPQGPHCVSASVLDDGFGKQSDCVGYRCVAGACLKRCSASSDCSANYACDGSGSCISDSVDPSAQEGGCGCAVPGSDPSGSRLLALGSVLVLFFAGRRRAQRKAFLARRSASSALPSASPS
jgi:MYXO-CTERM domain-containing protein